MVVSCCACDCWRDAEAADEDAAERDEGERDDGEGEWECVEVDG